MKLASLLVSLIGILALLLGGLERVLKTFILDIAPMSYLEVAATLFLLAIVLIQYDRTYGAAKKA